MRDITLNDLRTLLNYDWSKGTFATDINNTRGTFKLDSKGNLTNINRHRFLPKTKEAGADDNVKIREAVLEAFRLDRADKDFLSKARSVLGLDVEAVQLDENDEVMREKPLDRRTVKQLIDAYDKKKIDDYEKKMAKSYKTSEVMSENPVMSGFVVVERNAEKNVVRDMQDVPDEDEPMVHDEDVQDDAEAERMGKPNAASQRFVEELSEGFGKLKVAICGDSFRSVLFDDTVDKVKSAATKIAKEVVCGTRKSSSARKVLKKIVDDLIDNVIWDLNKEVQDEWNRKVEAALDVFVAALGRNT